MTHRALALLLALCLPAVGPSAAAGGAEPVTVLTGCRPDYVRPDYPALRAQLRAAQARWVRAGPRSYTYDLRRVAAPVLFPELRVTVRAGRVAGSRVLGEGEPASGALGPVPVEQLFAEVARAITYQSAQPCGELQVSFDRALGYPTRLYNGNGAANIADGWAEVTVKGLKAGG